MPRTTKKKSARPRKKLSYQLQLIRVLLARQRRGVSAEEAAPLIGSSVRTAFRHLSALRNAGLLEPVQGSRYALVRKPKPLPQPVRGPGRAKQAPRGRRR
jgi:Fic family protein